MAKRSPEEQKAWERERKAKRRRAENVPKASSPAVAAPPPPPVVVEVPGPFPVSTDPSEGARLLRLAVRQAGGERAYASRVGVSHPTIAAWQKGTPPGSGHRMTMHTLSGIPVSSWEEPARPPPPRASDEVLADLCLDQGLHRFLTEGPVTVVHGRRGYPLTPAQAALVKISWDDLDPADLEAEERDAAVMLYGDVGIVPARARRTLVWELGRESGKTSLVALAIVHRILTANLAGVFDVQVPAYAILAPSTRTSSLLFGQTSAALEGIEAVKERIEVSNGTEVILVRPTDGRRVAVRIYPRSVGGRALRGTPLLGLAIDEAAFGEQGRGDVVILDADQEAAARPRFVQGSKTIWLSTPWPSPSHMSKLVEDNWGKPGAALVARGTTLLLRANDPDVAERRAAMMADPSQTGAAKREYDLEVGDDGETFFYEGHLVDAACDPTIRQTGQSVSAGIDLGFRSDFSALVITERQGPRVVVVLVVVRKPQPGRPLDPVATCSEFADVARACGATYLVADSHSADETQRAASAAGMACLILDRSQLQAACEATRTLLVQRRLGIPHPETMNRDLLDGATLAKELKSIRSKPGPAGSTIFVRPRVAGQGHCDAASALEVACFDDLRRHGAFRSAVQTHDSDSRAQAPLGAVHDSPSIYSSDPPRHDAERARFVNQPVPNGPAVITPYQRSPTGFGRHGIF